MHRAAILCQLALWISGIQAVVPPTPGQSPVEVDASRKRDVEARDAVGPLGFVTFKMVKAIQDSNDQPITDKVTRMAHGLAKKYGTELPSRTDHSDATLVGRENTYSVVQPITPTQSNSAGVYQDGTDYSYFIQAHLGSAGTPMYMLIDTGASTTWVMGSGCKSDACKKHNNFGSEDSKTFKDTGTPFSVEYGSGEVSGEIISDSMKVAGLSVQYSFGLTNVTSDQFSSFPFDGILGLARSTGNFNDALKDAKLIGSNMFAVSLSRSSDGTNDGEITFGATNPAKYTGDITYTSVTDKVSWSIPMDDVTVSGKSAGVKGKNAYIDTGTTYAFAAPADVAAVYKMIPDSKSSDGGVTWTFPCDTTATVALTFSGKSFSINANDLKASSGDNNRCTGSIFGMEVVSGSWLLGDTFIKNVYTVFDIDGSRIGFASKAAGSGAVTTTPTTAVVSTVMSDGKTTLTTVTSTSKATSVPNMGFTGGHATTTGASNPTGTAENANTASSTGASPAGRYHVQGMLLAIVSIVSIIAIAI
ncbi:uncharacterized protein JN550_009236 [Neoarthrinium moseri]|uniref:uncharacterized protein n=1 Tax=Neoarthrinium moseri TaxID=1658444 RepID=UPI001FDD2A57|nr:uncharacterized protein JN550_009236 [Neoarthrinium moseri]KAI1863957.1 hypothetical protein JN550_009236 [Neoarthrinium moseri]